MNTPAIIRAVDVSLVLHAHKLRRYTRGRTCQMCALSPAPMLDVDCNARWGRADLTAASIRMGLRKCQVSPMQRGYISRVYERVKLRGGRAELLRTWGAGIRALRAEPRHVLNGGEAEA